MYGQTKKDQDTVRRLFPEAGHCKWLMADCNACDALPCKVADVEIGNPCPNNPYVKYEDLLDEQAENAAILEEAIWWQSIIDLKLVPNINEISAISFCFASAVRRYMKAQEMGAKLF